MDAPTRPVPGRSGVDAWQAASLYMVEHEGMMQLEIHNGEPHTLRSEQGEQWVDASSESPKKPLPTPTATPSSAISSGSQNAASQLDEWITPAPEERIRLRNGTAGRAVVVIEAPRAESLYVSFERTLSISRGIAAQAETGGEWNLPIERRDGETPLALSRRLYAASKNDPALAGCTASILASSTSALLHDALDCYFERFHFDDTPVDMALRGLLALEHLPAESQQIDRIMAAFAHRYAACNPDVLSADQTYLLSFALIMLHTATFNRNVKERMSRADFAAIAGPSGLERELLDYYYDNTTLVEFAYSRSEANESGTHGAFALDREPGRERSALYKLIATGRVHELRLRFAAIESLESPFTCAPRESCVESVREQFVRGFPLELRVSQKPPRRALWRNRSTGDEHSLLLRVSRLGIVRRREAQAARSLVSHAAYRWRALGLAVTGSALLWFRDINIISALRDQLDSGSGRLALRVDDVTPLDDALCVKEPGEIPGLRIHAQHRWYVIQPMDGTDTEWMDTINYVASLCSCDLAWDDAACLTGATGDASARVLPHRAHPAPLARIDTPRLSESSAPLMRPRSRHNHSLSMPDARTLRQKPPASSLAALNGDTRLMLIAALHGVNHHMTSSTQRAAQLNERLSSELRFMRHLCLITPLQRSTRDHFDALARQVHRALRATQYEYAYVECLLSALHVERAELESQLHMYT